MKSETKKLNSAGAEVGPQPKKKRVVSEAFFDRAMVESLRKHRLRQKVRESGLKVVGDPTRF